MTTKQCAACGGTGKRVVGTSPNGQGVLLGPCLTCVADALSNAAPTPKPKKAKKTKSAPIPEAGTGVGEVVKGVGGAVVDSFIEAGKQKIATECLHGMVDASKQLAAKFGWELPPHPMVDKGLALVMPVVVMLAAQLIGTQAPNAVPKALLDNLNAAATYALQGVSKETVNEVAAVAMPFALQIAALGAQALQAQLGAGSGQMGLPEAILDTETVTP